MNNFQPFGPRDLATLPEGDAAFIGVDERLAPQQTPAGYVTGAKNKRFRNGRVATRDGITLLPWLPVNGKTPWTSVLGGGVFNDPNQSGQWILVVAALAPGPIGVWKTRPGFVAQPVPLPAGVTLSADTFKKLLQANGAVLMLRGFDDDCLVMEDLEEGFKPVQQNAQWDVVFEAATNRVIFGQHNLIVGDPVTFTPSPDAALPLSVTSGQTYYVLETPDGDSFTIAGSPGDDTTRVTWTETGALGRISVLDGADPIPPASDGIFAANRVLLVVGKDELAVSDIGDFTRYQRVGQTFRINQGDSYNLVTVRIFNEDTLVCFKSGNVKKVTGLSGDLSQAVGPLNVTEAYGAVNAPGAVVDYGTEIYWLNSELRISSLTLTALNQEQGTDVALSDPLVKTFGRINTAYVAAARTAVFDGFLHVALPLDEAELVSDTELVPGGTVSGGPVPGLTPGQVYRYEQGANDDYLVNGTEKVAGSATFTAQATGAFVYGLAAGPVGASVKAVLAQGINNGVAVYDFLNQAWAGTDEAAGVTVVKDWLKFEYGGRPRLGFIGADGWLHLYGDAVGSNGPEDEKLVDVGAPYADVLIYDALQVNNFGASLQVNGGTALSMFGQTAATLWNDGTHGYDPAAPSPWSAPSTGPEQIADGVRFVATNGVLPEVKVNGSTVVDGASAWAFVDSHSGSEIQGVAIADLVRTRAYMCQRIYAQQPAAMVKRYRSVAAQLATWSPSYTLTTIVQGQGTENQVAPLDASTTETRDRTKYFVAFDHDAYDVTNGNDDFFARGREDYSVVATNLGFLIGSGLSLDALQEYVHRVDVNESGLWLQLEIANTDGRLELLATAMEGEGAEVLSGPQVA